MLFKTMKVCKSFMLVKIVMFLLLEFVCAAEQKVYFRMKHKLQAKANLTKSLSIALNDPHFIVGSTDGYLRIYNFKKGNLIGLINQQNSQIFYTRWQNDTQLPGLVTVSMDRKTNKSLAVLRKRHTFQQIYHWSFNQYMYGMDTSWSGHGNNYVGFNFMSRVQQYEIKNKTNWCNYSYGANKKIYDLAYAPYHANIHMIVDTKYLYFMATGNNQGGRSMGFSDVTFHKIESDIYSYDKTRVLAKYTYPNGTTQYRADLWCYQRPQPFPTIQISFYKYCPSDYLIGVTSQQTVIIYSKDYKFTSYGTITQYQGQQSQILQIQCKNGHLIISSTNNQISIFQLQPFQEDPIIPPPQFQWVYLTPLFVFVSIFMIMLSIVTIRKIRSNNRSKYFKSPNNNSSKQHNRQISQNSKQNNFQEKQQQNQNKVNLLY